MPPRTQHTGEAAPKPHGDRSGNVRVLTAYALALMGGATALGYGAYDTGSWPFDDPNCGVEDPTHANKVGNSAQEAAKTLGEQRGYYISSYRMAIVNNVQIAQYQPGRFCWEVPAPVIQGQVVIESPQTVADIAKFHGMSPEQLRALNVGNGYLPAGDNIPLDPGALLWTSGTVPANIHDALVEQTLTQDLATIVQSATAEQQTGIIAANFTLFMRGQTAAGGTAKLPASSKSVPYVGEYATRGAYTPGASIDGRPPSGTPQEQVGPTATPSPESSGRGLIIRPVKNPIDVQAAAAEGFWVQPADKGGDRYTVPLSPGVRVPAHRLEAGQLWQIVNRELSAVQISEEGFRNFKNNVLVDVSAAVSADKGLTDDFKSFPDAPGTINDAKVVNVVVHYTATEDSANDYVAHIQFGEGDSYTSSLQNTDGSIAPEFYQDGNGEHVAKLADTLTHQVKGANGVNNANSVGLENAASCLADISTRQYENIVYWIIDRLKAHGQPVKGESITAYVNAHVWGHNEQGEGLGGDQHSDFNNDIMKVIRGLVTDYFVNVEGATR